MFSGHYIYNGIRIIRLEFLIQQNYPDLVKRVKESEAWMDEQERTNPYYAGPITVRKSFCLKFCLCVSPKTGFFT